MSPVTKQIIEMLDMLPDPCAQQSRNCICRWIRKTDSSF